MLFHAWRFIPTWSQSSRRLKPYRLGFKDSKGTALTEAAILMPVFVLIIMGVAQFGRIGLAQIHLEMAVRQGARVASLGDRPDGAIQDVLEGLGGPEIENLQVSTSRIAQKVQVTARGEVEVYRIFRPILQESYAIESRAAAARPLGYRPFRTAYQYFLRRFRAWFEGEDESLIDEILSGL